MPGLDTLIPGAARPDPSAPPLAALGAMFPYLQRPTGLASMQPNAAGKIPEVDPLASWQPIIQGAIDAASFAGPEIAAKAAPAALHLLPISRNAFLGTESTTYKILNDLGEHVMNLETSFDPKKKQLYIDWAGTPEASTKEIEDLPSVANKIGPKELRSLIPALRAEYPEMRSLTGVRISGARRASEEAGGAYAPDPLIKFSGPAPSYPARPPAVEAALDENARRLAAEKEQEARAVRLFDESFRNHPR